MNKKITWVASNARRWAKLGRLSILNKPEVAVKRFQAAAAAGGSHKTESHSNFQVALVSGFMGKTLSANKKSNKPPTTNKQQEKDEHTQWHHGDALSTRASGKCRILEPCAWACACARPAVNGNSCQASRTNGSRTERSWTMGYINKCCQKVQFLNQSTNSDKR